MHMHVLARHVLGEDGPCTDWATERASELLRGDNDNDDNATTTLLWLSCCHCCHCQVRQGEGVRGGDEGKAAGGPGPGRVKGSRDNNNNNSSTMITPM